MLPPDLVPYLLLVSLMPLGVQFLRVLELFQEAHDRAELRLEDALGDALADSGLSITEQIDHRGLTWWIERDVLVTRPAFAKMALNDAFLPPSRFSQDEKKS